MAKDRAEATVEVPVSLLERMQARIEALEQDRRVREERADTDFRDKTVLDRRQAEFEAAAGKTPRERTQDRADREYGTVGQRWHCRLDSTREDGTPGPDIREWFGLTLSANSDLEAQARYLKIMGITRHDYRVVVVPAEAEALAPA